MDFELDDDQRAILESVEALLAQRAGIERARDLQSKGDYDSALEHALDEAGFLALALGDGTGALEATLLVEAVARAAGSIAAGAGAFVAPLLLGRALRGPVALADADADADAPIRWGAHARWLLVAAGDEARLVEPAPGELEPVRSSFGYAFGRARAPLADRGESLGAGSGERLRGLWRVAVAAEAVGCMEAALRVTLEHVRARRQFGRAIGSFQAVQHRLAECWIAVEASRWLAREAAWLGCAPEAAAAAAAQACAAAERVFAETHQLSGAIGFTHEHPLHVWSMRLPPLRLELAGAAGHHRALARARWASPKGAQRAEGERSSPGRRVETA